eukprot:gb/GECH01000202.1/.p1 GENE.gb/GECH01000202.1/~~gb/GECH01000202.1/.p1  ORF type:complete len:3078 (+),score=643.06 gb/GECH01000202.1/:1-9234(+)
MNLLRNIIPKRNTNDDGNNKDNSIDGKEETNYDTIPSDIPWSEEPSSQKLKELYDNYISSKSTEEKRINFKKFVSKFTAINIDWNTATSNSVQGHPNDVITSLCDHFIELCADILHKLENTLADISTDESNVVSTFEEPSNMKLFRAIEILSRSPHNRQTMKQCDALCKIAPILRITNSILNFVSDRYDESGPFYDFVQSLLGSILLILSHFTDSDKNSRGKTHKNSIASRRRVMVSYLSNSDIIKALVDTCSILAKLLENPVCSFSFEYSEMLLNIARSILTCDKGAQDPWTTSRGLSAIINLLQWPHEFSLYHNDWSDLKFRQTERLNSYYELSMLALHILIEALHIHPDYLCRLTELRLLPRIKEMGLWISFFFCSEESAELVASLQENSTPNVNISVTEEGGGRSDLCGQNSLSTSEMDWKHGNPPENHTIECPRGLAKRDNVAMLQFFEHLMRLSTVSEIFTNTGTQLDSESQQLHTELGCSMLKLFIPNEEEDENCAQARKKLMIFSDFQLYFFEFLVAMPGNFGTILDVLVNEDLYGVLFSEYFYLMGGKHSKVNASEISKDLGQSIANTRQASDSSLSDETDHEGKSLSKRWINQYLKKVEQEWILRCAVAETSKVIRNAILGFIKHCATLPARDNNVECKILLEMMLNHKFNSCIVAEIGVALYDIWRNSTNTEKSVIALNGMTTFSEAILAQMKIMKQNEGGMTEMSAPESAYSSAMEARNVVLNLLDLALRSHQGKTIALKEVETIQVLFSSLMNSHLKDLALRHVIALMETKGEKHHTDHMSLVSKFSETLIDIQRHPTSENMELLFEMLNAIQHSIHGKHRKELQKAFKEKLHFFVALLNSDEEIFENSTISPAQLCIQVLRTLTCLVSNNQKAKEKLKTEIGYDQIGQVILQCFQNKPSADLIDTLFDMMADGESAPDDRYLIQNADIASLLFQIGYHAENNEFVDFVNRFIDITVNNTRNQSSCCKAGLIEVLLTMIEDSKFSNEAINSLMFLLEILGKHSITVKELKDLFHLLKRQTSDVTNVKSSRLPMLIKTLQKMTQKEGAEAFLHMDGVRSGITLPTQEKWPSNRGYSICMWFRVESFQDPRDPEGSSDYQPRLLSFLNDDGKGIEYIFTNHLLSVVYHVGGNKKISQVLHNFDERKWYFIAIVHNCAKSLSFARSEIRLYVNYKLAFKVPFKYPHINKSLNKCAIGSNCSVPSVSKKHQALNGQTGAFYMFDDVLSEQQVSALYEAGPNFMWSTPSQQLPFSRGDYSVLNTLFESSSSHGRLFLAYNPKAIQGNTLLDNTPESSRKAGMEGTIRSGTIPCATHNVQDIIGCLGGIKVLFPLFLQMDILSHTEESLDEVDPYLTAEIVALFSQLLYEHPDNQSDMERCNGFLVINFLLKQISPKHLTIQSVNHFKKLFHTVCQNETLYKDCLQYLLFDFRLWIYTSPDVQKHLIEKLITEIESREKGGRFNKMTTQRIKSTLRSLVGVQHILDILRLYYWFKEEPGSQGTEVISNPVTHEVLGKRPDEDNIKEIRQLLMKLIKNMVGGHLSSEESLSFIRFCHDCNDSMQLIDVLSLLLELIITSDPDVLANLIDLGVYEMCFNLVATDNEDVRIKGLEIMGKLLELSPKLYERAKADKPYGFANITENLEFYPFTKAVYKAMRDVLLAEVSVGTEISDVLDDDAHTFKVPAAIAPIFKLLNSAEMEVKLYAVQDFSLLLKTREDSRNVFLTTQGWQNWLFDLMASSTEHDESSKQAVKEFVLDILKTLLYHALSTHSKGWSILEETLAYLYIHEEREGALDTVNIQRSLFNLLLDTFLMNLHRGRLPSDLRQDKTPLTNNFIHFVLFVEEFMFYNKSVLEQMKKERMRTDASSGEDSPSLLGALPLIRRNSSISVDSSPGSPSSKRMSSSSSLSYSAEAQLYRDENGVWLDLNLAEKLLSIFEEWKLASIANFEVIPQLQEKKKHFRTGGTLRIALRVIQYCLRESNELKMNNIHCIKEIIQRDVEAEEERQRFSELWTVTGDIEEAKDFQNRVLHVLAFLFETMTRYVESKRKSEAQIIFELVQYIFKVRNEKIHEILQDEDGNQLLDKQFPYSNMKKFFASLDSPNWKDAWNYYFLQAVANEDAQQAQFLSEIIKRRLAAYDRVEASLNHLHKEEDKFSSNFQAYRKRLKENHKYEETSRRAAVMQKYEETSRQASRIWKKIMRNVSNERGPWGTPLEQQNRVFWKLDHTENSQRKRIKLKIMNNGTDHREAAVEQPETPLSLRNNSSFFVPRLSVMRSAGNQDEPTEDVATTESEWDLLSGDDSAPIDNHSISASDEEKKLLSIYCEQITPMQAFSGTMEITNKHIYWFADKENQCDTQGPTSVIEALQSVKDRKWGLDQISELHLRRYRLQRSALELFLWDKTNYLFNFEKKKRNSVYKKILNLKPPNLRHVHGNSPSANLRSSGLTQAWVRREISNFDYLMQLNTFAGRTYNDLTQYPVFPWVIQQYTEDTIDLEDPKTYRDLSKPVGALHPESLKRIIQKYEGFEDDVIPKFHYGSHYSSSGIVSHYLIRLEPFTSYAIILQGGKFDHADRLFDSIPQTWNNVLTDNNDTKELIPEFFYLPEFLRNINDLDLGEKQTGQKLGDITLPPWAESPEHFIRINREALESEFVSQNLHHWIDLIFGCKQRGEEAVKAHNVFYYLTYEGAVDLDSLDEVERAAALLQIDNFGQTPIQLFKPEHPRRMNPQEAFNPRRDRLPNDLEYTRVIFVTPDRREQRSLVLTKVTDDKVITVGEDGTFAVNKLTPQGFMVDSNIGQPCRRLRASFAPNTNIFFQTFEIFLRPSSRELMILSCAHWDSSFTVTSLNSALLSQRVYRHKDVVTCLNICPEGDYVVTGSKDTTVMIWEIEQRKSANVINPEPFHILYGHDDEVTTVTASLDLDVVVSGSKDGTVIVQSLRKGKYIRTIHYPANNATVDLVAIHPQGYVVMYSTADLMIHLYTINGRHLKSIETFEARINYMRFHENYLITGGDKRVVHIRKYFDLSAVARLDLSKDVMTESAAIHSIAFDTYMEYMYVGTSNGSLATYAANIPHT